MTKQKIKSARDLSDWALKNRIRFWKKVRTRYLNQTFVCEPYEKLGLCSCISYVRKNGGKNFASLYSRKLHEFESRKPKTCWAGGSSWWWNPYLRNSRMKRVEVCDSILAELKAEKVRRGI